MHLPGPLPGHVRRGEVAKSGATLTVSRAATPASPSRRQGSSAEPAPEAYATRCPAASRTGTVSEDSLVLCQRRGALLTASRRVSAAHEGHAPGDRAPSGPRGRQDGATGTALASSRFGRAGARPAHRPSPPVARTRRPSGRAECQGAAGGTRAGIAGGQWRRTLGRHASSNALPMPAIRLI